MGGLGEEMNAPESCEPSEPGVEGCSESACDRGGVSDRGWWRSEGLQPEHSWAHTS